MLEIKHVTKYYDTKMALDDVNLVVKDGVKLGIIGKNGAGKSTLMNLVTGYIAPTSGSIAIDGADVVTQPTLAKKRLGYLPENPPVYVDMTILEYLRFAAEVKGVTKTQREVQIQQVMRSLGLDGMEHRLIRHLSKGYRQRTGLAQALLGEPSLVVLDEPTVGLDPSQLKQVTQAIRELKCTVVFLSHILSDVSEICDEIVIINDGRLAERFSMEKQQNALLLRVRVDKNKAEKALQGYTLEPRECTEKGAVEYIVRSAKDIREELSARLAAEGVPLLYLAPYQVSVSEQFSLYTQGSSV